MILALAVALLAHSVTLTWTPTTRPGSIRQSVQRQIGCTGAWVQRAQAAPGTTAWTDNVVAAGKTYCYQIVPVFAKGETWIASNTAKATVPKP